MQHKYVTIVGIERKTKFPRSRGRKLSDTSVRKNRGVHIELEVVCATYTSKGGEHSKAASGLLHVAVRLKRTACLDVLRLCAARLRKLQGFQGARALSYLLLT